MWVGKVIFILFNLSLQIFGFTHWIVTENGRIEAKFESQYNLRRPYDLLALIEQEKRYDQFDKVVKKLVLNKNLIDQKTEDVISSAKQVKANNCLENLAVDLDFIIFTNGSKRVKIDLFDKQKIENSNKEPSCASFSNLDYSMFTYEHLDSINGNIKLLQTPKPRIIQYLPHSDIDFTGKQISYGLKLNTSSWIHYNLGILFWSLKGNTKEALDCAKRAIYFAPRMYRDIPLLNLAGILSIESQSLRDEEIILKAVIDHNPGELENYFYLGLVYTELKETEKAMNCFKIIDKLQATDIVSRNRKSLAQCFLGLERVIETHHDNLQEILKFLLDFQGEQQHWINLQNRLIWETAYENQNIPSILEGYDHWDQKLSTFVNQGKKLENIIKKFKGKDYELYKTVESNLIDNEDEIDHAITSSSIDLDYTSKLLPVKYPTSMKVSNQLYFDSIQWPESEGCGAWNLPLTEEENLNLPVFLPLENKGFEVEKMLGLDIGISENEEHKLPWYPPVCDPSLPPNINTKTSKIIRPGFNKVKIDKPLPVNNFFKEHFLNYINKGKTVEEEIGQRILTAVEKKTGPTWALSLLASMYWRVKLNTKNAATCLEMAFDNVPEEFNDVVFVSIASVLHQLGLYEKALSYLKLAFKVNFHEPSTNFLLALIYYQKNNPILAMYYLKNVLRVDPAYYNGEAERLLKLWACRIKLGAYSSLPEGNNGVRNLLSNTDGYTTEGVVCSASGDQCKTASIQCFKTDGIKNENAGLKKDCNTFTLTKESVISKFLIPQGASNIKGEIELETIIEPLDNLPVQILIDKLQANSASTFTFGDLYVSVTLSNDPVPEVLLHVFEKTNSYLLSESKCKEIKDSEWIYFTSMWQSIAGRNINIGRLLSPLPSIKEYLKPFCLKVDNPKENELDDLVINLLLKNLPNVREESLLEWLGLISADQQSSIQELGTKISFALRSNSTSWLLTTAASFYWRIIGNTKEAVICLQQAINNVPSEMKDIPLISLANILHRIGYYRDAILVTIEALKSHPAFVINPFTAGNIYTSSGDYETAILLYQAALAIDPNFEPARERLKGVLCAVIFDQKGSLPNFLAFN